MSAASFDMCTCMCVPAWLRCNNSGGADSLGLESEGNKPQKYSPGSDRGTMETVTSPQHLTCPEPELDSHSTQTYTHSTKSAQTQLQDYRYTTAAD